MVVKQLKNVGLALVMLTSLPVYANVNLKVGFVNSFDAMRECQDGKKVTQKIEDRRNSMTKELEEDQAAFQKKMTDFQAKSSVLTQEARQVQEKELRTMRSNLENKAKELQYELETMVSHDTESLARNVEQLCEPLAKEKNLDVVIDAQTGRVFYVKEEFQHTDDLISLLNKNNVADAKTPAVAVAAADTKAADTTKRA